MINSKTEDPVKTIYNITGCGPDFALETTGRPTILKQGIDSLGNLVRIAVVGAPALGTNAEFDVNDLLNGGKTIMGVVQGNSVPKGLFQSW